MIWITSDFHFGHEKEFLWQPRGFTDWKEHAEAVIKNYNSLIKNGDEVYILGDCMLKNDDYGIECLKRLNGHKYLAIGNHDNEARIAKYQIANIFEKIEYGYRLRSGKYTIWLQHYPAMMGNYKDKAPALCFAGHTHSPDEFQNMSFGVYNIALDAHKCCPISLPAALNNIKEYRKTHPVEEYIDKTPYCASCAHYNICAARTNHDLACLGFSLQPTTATIERCDKCVYIKGTCGQTDKYGNCWKYKRDPPDGGYYG